MTSNAQTATPPASVPPLDVQVGACEDAIGRYATLRPELFRQVVLLKQQLGGPWRIQYKRDPAEGDPSVPPKVTHYTAVVSELAGQPFEGIATFRDPETYAPFHDFAILDPAGHGPTPGTTTAVVEMRLRFLLDQLLAAAKLLAATLPEIERRAGTAGLGVDTTALSRLDTRLPVFPYWPRSPKEMSDSDFDRVLADERPLLDDARLILRRLLTASPPAAPIPAATADNLYRRALDVVYATGCGMEQHPRTYRGRGEEDLRDHLLTVLRSHFQSVTGETFNKRGKTDILIRQGDNHVLVAECKVWEGPKSLTGAVDQVLSYLTWRDARAAVVMFVPNKDPIPVLAQFAGQVNTHPCCSGPGIQEQPGWFAFDFRLCSSSMVGVQLAVLCFHFPPN